MAVRFCKCVLVYISQIGVSPFKIFNRYVNCFTGDDRYGYEKANERWLPIHTVETILISVISMLADPNDESPANVDAAKEWRDAYPEFK